MKDTFCPAEITIGGEKRILVVDDNEINLMLAIHLLQPYNMETDTATSGKEALKKAKEKEYHLIFMDQMMPEMDGVETTAELRKCGPEYCKSVPVIALTANAVDGAKEELLASGFDDYMAKPINVRQLEEILRTYVGVKEGETVEQVKDSTLSLEGIDCSGAMKKMYLSETAYLGILKNYYKDLGNALQRILTAKLQGDIKNFVIDVHGVKSTSAGIGAMELSECAKNLEAAGKKEDTEYIDSHMDDFVQEAEAVLKVLENFFTEKSEEEEPQEAELSVLDKTWLEAVRQACENMDSSVAEELLEQVRQKRFEEKEAELVKQIMEYVDQFDYDEVVALLAEVL